MPFRQYRGRQPKARNSDQNAFVDQIFRRAEYRARQKIARDQELRYLRKLEAAMPKLKGKMFKTGPRKLVPGKQVQFIIPDAPEMKRPPKVNPFEPQKNARLAVQLRAQIRRMARLHPPAVPYRQMDLLGLNEAKRPGLQLEVPIPLAVQMRANQRRLARSGLPATPTPARRVPFRSPDLVRVQSSLVHQPPPVSPLTVFRRNKRARAAAFQSLAARALRRQDMKSVRRAVSKLNLLRTYRNAPRRSERLADFVD